MTFIHTLAPELLLDIFELAHDPRKPSTMCAASLVCRAWRDPAQRKLFRDIAVPMIPTYGKSDLISAPIREGFQRWDAYRSSLLYGTPRRIELLERDSKTFGRDQAGSSLRWISGTKHLKLSVTNEGISYLNAPELQGIERLELHIKGWDWRTGRQDFPVTVDDVSIILLVNPKLPIMFTGFLANVRNIHQFTFDFGRLEPLSMIGQLLPVLARILPASIRRLGFKNVVISSYMAIPGRPLLIVPLAEIKAICLDSGLTSLQRIDFPDCERKDLEYEVVSADLLAECKRRSIMVVCSGEL
ncbi:hypothetical protein RQP46_008085 [Phenoliferia psychrophenolica]